jgi:peptidoglycan/xylan/chitin deacetylase (PgdA/CDA1 family)
MLMKWLILVLLLFFPIVFLVFFGAPKATGATAVNNQITAGADDTNYISGGVFSATGNTLKIGKDQTDSAAISLRFTNLAIPSGSTITDAIIAFKTQSESTGGGSISVQIAAEATDTPTAPTSEAEFATKAANLTTARVDWNFSVVNVWGGDLSTVDIAPVIQEIIDRPGWTSGSNIQIFIQNNGSSNYNHQNLHSYEIGAASAATLSLNYDTPNEPPVANNDTSQTLFETSRLIDVLTNDTDANSDTLTITGVSDPESGTAVIEAGQIRYTPNNGFSGEDTFTYDISDGRGGSDTASVTVTVHPQSTHHSFTVTFNKASVPALYYYDLTANVYVGDVDSVVVENTDGGSITSSYDENTGYVRFTTSENQVVVITEGLQSLEGFGNYTFEKLKYGKSWAWSHGLDDNVNLAAQIAAIKAKGWRAMLYLIGESIDDTREEGWIEDVPDIHRHLADGWSIGNHGWHSECVSEDPEVLENDVILGYNRLVEIVAGSSIPTYKITAFAAPCFRTNYTPIILDHRDQGTTAVQFNESGSNYEGLLLADDLSGSATDYINGSYGATALTYDSLISRNTSIGIDNADVMARMDWASANSGSSRHIWFNTLTHGNQESDLSTILDYAYDTYGPDGSDELWMAPADEIYSYFLVRDNTTVTIGSLQTVETESPPPTPTPAPTPTPETTPGDNDSSQSGTSHNANSNTPSNQCSTPAPFDSPQIFLVRTLANKATIYFVPITNNVSYYYLSFSQDKSAEAHGTSFDINYPATGVLTFEINELEANTSYYAKIRAGNGCQPGDWSEVYQFKTQRESRGWFGPSGGNSGIDNESASQEQISFAGSRRSGQNLDEDAEDSQDRAEDKISEKSKLGKELLPQPSLLQQLWQKILILLPWN